MRGAPPHESCPEPPDRTLSRPRTRRGRDRHARSGPPSAIVRGGGARHAHDPRPGRRLHRYAGAERVDLQQGVAAREHARRRRRRLRPRDPGRDASRAGASSVAAAHPVACARMADRAGRRLGGAGDRAERILRRFGRRHAAGAIQRFARRRCARGCHRARRQPGDGARGRLPRRPRARSPQGTRRPHGRRGGHPERRRAAATRRRAGPAAQRVGPGGDPDRAARGGEAVAGCRRGRLGRRLAHAGARRSPPRTCARSRSARPVARRRATSRRTGSRSARRSRNATTARKRARRRIRSHPTSM